MGVVTGILTVVAAAICLVFMAVLGIAQIILPFVIWGYIIKAIRNSVGRTLNHNFFKNNVVFNSKDNINKKARIYKDVSKDKLAIFNTDDIDSLKKYFSELFIKYEIAYNNLDYNTMKMISTKQFFQNYYTGITLNLKVGKKRIIDNIQLKKIIIYELDSTISKQTVSAMIEVSYINYVIDSHGYTVSGDRENPIIEKFEVTFRKDFEKNDITKCPNCGANIVGNKCEYCRNVVKNEEFKISNIKKIIEE